jgi:hypothetical protein
MENTSQQKPNFLISMCSTPWFQSSLLTAVALVFFVVIGFPEFFSQVPLFQQRWFGIGTLLFYSLLSTTIFSSKSVSKIRRIGLWLNSFLLMFFSALYFIRLNNSPFELIALTINTKFIFVPLTAFIWYVNTVLLETTKNKSWFPSLVGQIILIGLTAFSLVYYFDIDATSQREFQLDALEAIFELPLYVLIIFAATTGSFISSLSLKIKKNIDFITIFLFFFTTFLQVGIILNNLMLGYWAKTLIFLIMWDFIYKPTLNYLKHPNEKFFTKRLYLSTIYHVGLVFLVLLVNLK